MKRFLSLRTNVLACLAILVSQQVGAADRTLTFVYSPNPANPGSNQFINTTRNEGFCIDRPGSCGGQTKSITTGIGRFSDATIVAGSTPSQGVSVKVPAGWHDVEVSNGSERATVRFRITGFSGRHSFDRSVLEITGASNPVDAYDALWVGGSWGYGIAPCGYSANAVFGPREYTFFWSIPESGDFRCGSVNNFDLHGFRFLGHSLRYIVEMPDPQSLPSGRYTGTKTFHYGPGLDFDFGATMNQPNVLNLNFDVVVDHVLEASFPPGSSTAVLQPQGGWLQWLQRGRRPEKLSIDQNFRFSTNNAFKMHIECQYTLGNQCGIQNGSGHQVPVESRVTLPAGINNASGQPANRQLLSPVDKHVFTPTRLVNDSRAKLHFEVGRDDVKDMIDHHSGSKYSGNVTVIWDSDIAAP
ncbi:hypothetical protein D3C77_329520 [compost metagenome]